MGVRVYINTQPWLDALDAHVGPGEETVLALGAVLAAQFQVTQEQVDIITGSLKASGRTKQRTTDTRWTGELSYGGAAPGMPHPVVRYARQEFGRGGDHDAMRGVDLFHEDYLEAMSASVRARLQ